MLLNAPDYLNKDGLLFFPIISLSNVDRILEVAKESFLHVECLSSSEWTLPKEISSHEKLLNDLQNKKYIHIKKKFGLATYFTDICVAYN